MRLGEVCSMCWWEVLHHFVQRKLGLRRFASGELAWDFHYVHHPAGRSHTYRQHRCPRRSHGVRMKHRLIGWIDHSFSFLPFSITRDIPIASLYIYHYFPFNHAWRTQLPPGTCEPHTVLGGSFIVLAHAAAGASSINLRTNYNRRGPL